MALLKSTSTTPSASSPAQDPSREDWGSQGRGAPARGAAAKSSVDQKRQRARTMAKQQQAAERIASASMELSASVAEAGAATEELAKAMQQIAAGATQAASASEESAAATAQISRRVGLQAEAAELSMSLTAKLQSLLDDSNSEISNLVNNVDEAAQKQVASVEMMAKLEAQAEGIIEVINQVIRIADQTNLLALNAAIEAARAGRHGKGFAVVADKVRTLAEASEKNATSIEGLIKQVQSGAKEISQKIGAAAGTAQGEVEKGRAMTAQLSDIRRDMVVIMEGARELASAAAEMGAAASQAQKGSEEVAAAAEEQSAGAEQAMKAVEQQSAALAQAEQASNELDGLAEELKNSSDIAKSSEEVAAAAEELSSTIQELNRASSEIMTAINQIADTASVQAAAVEEGVAGISQIESNVGLARDRAAVALEKGSAISALLSANRTAVNEMIAGIVSSAETGRASLTEVQNLEMISRKVDKIVDAIANVAIQTGMLAVNGAVEAARAGEYGKGFAVVSTDIQNLADEAAENAEQIKDMVKAIQDQIGVVRADLSATATAALQEVERAKHTTVKLTTITRDMEKILEGNREIQTAAQEIAEGVKNAKNGMEQIAAAAEQAQSAAEQASGAARQQADGGKELAAAIEHIAAIADELQS